MCGQVYFWVPYYLYRTRALDDRSHDFRYYWYCTFVRTLTIRSSSTDNIIFIHFVELESRFEMSSAPKNNNYVAPCMPLLSISSLETIEKCSRLPLHNDDIFICSYPKSGTTWMQHIIVSLLIYHDSNLSFDHISDFAPFFEIDPHWDGDDLIDSIRQKQKQLGRRVFNTHLRWDMLPKNSDKSKAKFIYIVRSPLDVCVSFYHHLSNQVEGGFEGTFEEFFQQWTDGQIAFGSWIDHVLSFSHPAFEKHENLLFVSYDDMLSKLEEVVTTLVKFLGLSMDPENIRELLPTFTFQYMKDNIQKFQPKSVTWKNNFQFIRKGKSGDADTLISPEQKSIFREKLCEKQYERIIQNLWELTTMDNDTNKLYCRLKNLSHH